MAVDPIAKAKALVELSQGVSVRQVAKNHGVNKDTVTEWSKEVQEALGKSSAEIKQQTFAEAFERFGIAAMEMLIAQAELLTDQDYLRKQESGDVIKHTEFISDRLTRFIQLQRGQNPTALPERAVEAEVVDV